MPDPAPISLTPPEAWPEYAYAAGISPAFAAESVGVEPRGVRYAAWPRCIEEYFGDAEPDLAASKVGRLARNRVVYWKRAARSATPPGWHAGARPWRIDGYVMLAPDYRTRWSRNARRNVESWHASPHRYTWSTVPLRTFEAAYLQSTVADKVGTYYIDLFKRRWDAFPAKPELWLARDESGAPLAGAAVHFFDRRGASVWECPFISPKGMTAHAAAGLMERWFDESLERGITMLVNTYFWQEGDPLEWRGLSEFKLRYGFATYAYPPLLSRFVPGKLF